MLPVEPVAVADALDRVLATAVVAQTDVPGFDNSAMDGFAVSAGPADRTLPIADESRAGAPAAAPFDPATAVRISTGAALPSGANAVIPVELTAEQHGQVTLGASVTDGMNVRRAGEDMHAGTEVLSPGTRLGPAELAVAVGAGCGAVDCARRPRLAVITTGDELRPPGEPLGPGQIHDTNTTALTALARRAGADITATARVGDDPAATHRALCTALETADVVAITGGVSVGAHDHVKPALAELGVTERFWGVQIRPGRPTWFGSRDTTLVFGLPGNPVSASVIFMLLVRPALAALQGERTGFHNLAAVTVAPVRRNPARAEAMRVRLRQSPDGRLEAEPTGPQGSHITTSLVGADALALIPAGEGDLPAGSRVEVERL